MSEVEMRLASDDEVVAIEARSAPFIDALQCLSPAEAMKLWCYISARLILDLKPKPGISRISGFDRWAQAVRTTIERNEALHSQ